jgi:alpha-tubulin suppressor-like RCC1 family protein
MPTTADERIRILITEDTVFVERTKQMIFGYSLFSFGRSARLFQVASIVLCLAVGGQTALHAQEIWGTGYNAFGQLGTGNSAVTKVLTRVIAASGPTENNFFPAAISAATGANHTLALDPDGNVWGWGRNQHGQVGNGNRIDRSRPARVRASASAFFTNVIAISAGGEFSLALKGDGTVWAWGLNNSGQFGDGTTTNSDYPVQVKKPESEGEGFLENIVAISAGGSHCMALRSDGTVWTWGYGGQGRLGDGMNATQTRPVQVLGEFGDDVLTRIVAVSAGTSHSLALRADGYVFAWGFNDHGAIGDNTQIHRPVPVPVVDNAVSGNLGDVISISAGSEYSLAVKRDGSVYSWGTNFHGVLGIDLTSPLDYRDLHKRISPVRVHNVGNAGLLTNCVSVAAGSYHATALRSDGTIVSWGYNEAGALGDDTLGTKDEPVTAVQSSNNIYAIFSASQAGHKMVLRANGTLRIQVQLNNAMSLGTPLDIELRPVGGTPDDYIRETVNAGPAGVITLTDIPAGTYNVAIKGSKWLRQVVPNVSTLGGANVLNLRFNLRAGDCNNDNVVDIEDLLILIAAYNSANGGATFDARGDFNGDNRVDVIDLLPLIGNYNVKGDL